VGASEFFAKQPHAKWCHCWRAIGGLAASGIGELLLADAVRRALGAARLLAVHAIVVDARDEPAAAFYRCFGFASFPNRPFRLFMPVTDAIEAMSRALSG
jgi:hypothetical protein